MNDSTRIPPVGQPTSRQSPWPKKKQPVQRSPARQQPRRAPRKPDPDAPPRIDEFA